MQTTASAAITLSRRNCKKTGCLFVLVFMRIIDNFEHEHEHDYDMSWFVG